MPAPVTRKSSSKASAAILAIGSSDGAVIEAQDKLGAQGIHLDYMRVRGFPFADAVQDFMANYDTVFVVEQNRDAQLRSLLINETNVTKAKLIPVTYYAGDPLSYKFVMEAISEHNKVRKTA